MNVVKFSYVSKKIIAMYNVYVIFKINTMSHHEGDCYKFSSPLTSEYFSC